VKSRRAARPGGGLVPRCSARGTASADPQAGAFVFVARRAMRATPAAVSDDDEPSSLSTLARGFTKRTLVTAKLAARVGVGFARRSLGRGRSEEEGERDDAAAVADAGELVEQLGRLKGLVMKFGQIASYMPGALPPRAQQVLTQLQAHTTAMAWPQVAEVLRRELGDEPEALFESIEHTPFAAASIGQVHRARFDGRAVAVKIQYPDIEDALRQDLKAAKVIAKLGMIGTDLDANALVGELRERMLEECDYSLEARRQIGFRRLLRGYEGADVPEVIEARCARRVLTTALVQDRREFYAFCSEADQAVRDRAGEIVFRTCMGSIFRDCIYNGDPHPGNYLFAADGGVTFLDFGCVRAFSPDMIAVWKRVGLATLAGDQPAFREAYVDLGFVKRPDRFDWDHQWELMRYLYRPFLATEPFEFTHDYVRESYSVMLFDNPNRFRTAMPAEWLLLNRLQWGMTSILAHLHARVQWGTILRECFGSQTAPVAL
jgi:predicted unusual protein kinase regulating ubiquinone biosynthesis (AarF/ABC1/UbiB family)